jgi:hypothetical protein
MRRLDNRLFIPDIENLFQQFNFTLDDVLRGGKYIAAQAGTISRAVPLMVT